MGHPPMAQEGGAALLPAGRQPRDEPPALRQGALEVREIRLQKRRLPRRPARRRAARRPYREERDPHAFLRQHRRLCRRGHDGRHLGDGRLVRANRQERAPFGRRRHRRRAGAVASQSRDHRGQLLHRCPIGSRRGCRGARGLGALDGRIHQRDDQDRRPRQWRSVHGRGAALFGGGAGLIARKTDEERATRPGSLLRRDREARGRADTLQDQHQRAAARLAHDPEKWEPVFGSRSCARKFNMSADPIAIARDLIRCRSVTPAEGGALALIETLLKGAGFEVHRVTFAEAGTDPVENLYARIGTAAPHLMLAGHTDVVPPGDESKWTHPPFAAEIADGVLYGRGAVDMKGGIAAKLAAALDYVAACGGKPKGSLSFLITGDEEGIAVNGTVKLLQWAAERGEKFDHCILGEPTNPEKLGDMIKIGRRGSQNGTLIAPGGP